MQNVDHVFYRAINVYILIHSFMIKEQCSFTHYLGGVTPSYNLHAII
jgi:hypothetical protein